MNLSGGSIIKKIVLAAALTGMVAFVGVNAVSADTVYGYGYCSSYGNYETNWDAENSKVLYKYLDEAATLRKELVAKEAELAALLRQKTLMIRKLPS